MTTLPDQNGFYGPYGGQFIPPQLTDVVNALSQAFIQYRDDPQFIEELNYYEKHFTGRPSPVYFCENLTRQCRGARIYLKREDLNHLGAHKVNNTVGQILLAKRMGKKKIIAETGAGQHGVATAATAALMGMECVVVMGAEDMKRQELNVFRMQMMGAEVVPATSGQRTLKEAVDEALEMWIKEADTAFYLLGSAVGPHPYPAIVRHFQAIIGREAREQILELEKKLPDSIVACVGGGSNAIGFFSGFLEDTDVKIYGVEPAGRGLRPGDHAATLTLGTPGVLHGFNSYMLKDEKGEAAEVYSISAGLDYPSVGPEHSFLKDSGRVAYTTALDSEAVQAFFALSRNEGIIPALESAHALAEAMKQAPQMDREQVILVNLSGRGDKDVAQIKDMLATGVIKNKI